jgi:hypothetical protein
MPLLDAGLVVHNHLHDAYKDGVVIHCGDPKLFSALFFPLMSWIDAAAKITEHDYIAFTNDSTLDIAAPDSAADADADTSDTGIIYPPIPERQIALKQVIRNKGVFKSDNSGERLPVNQQLYRESSMSFRGTKAKSIHNVSI